MSEQKLATPLPTNPSTPIKPSFQLNCNVQNASPPSKDVTSSSSSSFSFQPATTLPVSRNKSITPDVSAVNELITNMKETLLILGKTFDCLGEQTYKMAALGPAIQGSQQIANLRAQLNAQHARQESRMQEVKMLLRDVLKAQLAEHLSARVDTMIHERIEREVKDRIAKQLKSGITNVLCAGIAQHKLQILEVQINLYNSEARRHNALLDPSAVHEPLCPLLRPLSSLDSDAKMTTLPALPQELPASSPLFPRDLAALFALTYETVKALFYDYGLDNEARGDERECRDMYLNQFMAHIGVPFQVVSASPMHAVVTSRWR